MKECKPEGGIQNLGAVLEFCLPQFRTLHRVLKLDFLCKERKLGFGWGKFLSFHLFPSGNFFQIYLRHYFTNFESSYYMSCPTHSISFSSLLSSVRCPIYFSASSSKECPGRMPSLSRSTLGVHLMSLFCQRIQFSKAVQSLKIVASYVLSKFAVDFFSPK